MRKVLNGCKVCGKRMLTAGSPLIHRTCDACKAKQRRTDNSRLAAKRKAKRHAAKVELNVPRCQQCGEMIEDAARLEPRSWRPPQWARKFCGNRCRQAAFRARSG